MMKKKSDIKTHTTLFVYIKSVFILTLYGTTYNFLNA